MAANKDRAQAAATWAMSVVHVTLFRTVLDKGPNSKYFWPTIILISIAIVLQIIAGILTLLVANVKKVYRVLNEPVGGEHMHCNVCGAKILCCARWLRKDHEQENIADILQAYNDATDNLSLFSVIEAATEKSNRRLCHKLAKKAESRVKVVLEKLKDSKEAPNNVEFTMDVGLNGTIKLNAGDISIDNTTYAAKFEDKSTKINISPHGIDQMRGNQLRKLVYQEDNEKRMHAMLVLSASLSFL